MTSPVYLQGATNPFSAKDNFGSISGILQKAAFPSRRNISQVAVILLVEP
jgi:hypothetical protein